MLGDRSCIDFQQGSSENRHSNLQAVLPVAHFPLFRGPSLRTALLSRQYPLSKVQWARWELSTARNMQESHPAPAVRVKSSK